MTVAKRAARFRSNMEACSNGGFFLVLQESPLDLWWLQCCE